MDELEKFRENVLQMAKDLWGLRKELRMPTMFALVDGGKVLVMPMEMPEQQAAKDMIACIIGATLERLNAYACVFVTEAWYSEIQSKAAFKKGDYTMPSKDPNRKEALILMYESASVQKQMIMPIKRDGGIVTLEDTPWMDTQAEGRFAGFLKEK